MKTKAIKKSCIHCGKPRATVPIDIRGATLWMHKSCSEKLDLNRLALANQGKV